MQILATPPRGREDYRHGCSIVDSMMLLAVSFNGSFSKLIYVALRIAYTSGRLINFAYIGSSSGFATKYCIIYICQPSEKFLRTQLKSSS